MMELYDNYREKKNPFDMEKDFCDMINKLQQDDDFKKRIVPYPELKEIFDRLQKLYQQYEEKQKLYDEIDRVESEDVKKDDVKKDETADKNNDLSVDKK